LVAMCVAVLAFAGTEEPGVHLLLRSTARTSALLFLVAFLARPLRQLWRSRVSGYLLENRRYFGVSMAVSHLLHGLGILWLIMLLPADQKPHLTTLVFGGLAYVFLAAMVATSSDAAVRKLGRTTWTRLHRTGMWYLWFIFTFTLFGGLKQTGDVVHVLLFGAFVAAPLVRIGAWVKTRRRRAVQVLDLAS
jgi:methionine sulfoxide reductase heme-binding subunit